MLAIVTESLVYVINSAPYEHVGIFCMKEKEKELRFALLCAGKRKCGLWENILFSKCERLELKRLSSLSGIFLCGIMVFWVCGLHFIRNRAC